MLLRQVTCGGCQTEYPATSGACPRCAANRSTWPPPPSPYRPAAASALRILILVAIIVIPLSLVGLEYIGDVNLGIRRTVTFWGSEKYVGTWKAQAYGTDFIVVLNKNGAGQAGITGSARPISWRPEGDQLVLMMGAGERITGRLGEDGKSLTLSSATGQTTILTKL